MTENFESPQTSAPHGTESKPPQPVPKIVPMWTLVLAVVLFWPCGLLALRRGQKAAHAAKFNDEANAVMFAASARKWRNIAYAVAGFLCLLFFGAVLLLR